MDNFSRDILYDTAIKFSTEFHTALNNVGVDPVLQVYFFKKLAKEFLNSEFNKPEIDIETCIKDFINSKIFNYSMEEEK